MDARRFILKTRLRDFYKLSAKMPELRLVKFVVWSPLIQVVVLVTGIVLSFLTAVIRHDVSWYLPFISETGAYSPEMSIFSLFLIASSFIGCIVTTVRYLLILQSNNESLKKLNLASFIVGIIAMSGLAGVAAFPMTTVISIHLAVAAIYFVGSTIYFILAAIMTWKLEGRSVKLYVRIVLTLILLGLLLSLVITFPISLQKWHEHNKLLPALKTPEHKGFTLVLVASILEWSTGVIICLSNLTFILEMRNHELVLAMTPLKNQSISEPENPAPATEETIAT